MKEWIIVVALVVTFITNIWIIDWLQNIERKIMEHNRKLELFVKNTNYYMGLHVNEYKIGYEHGNENGLKDMRESIDDLEMIND